MRKLSRCTLTLTDVISKVMNGSGSFLQDFNGMADNISSINLVAPGCIFLVSKSWYKKCVLCDFLDSCDFGIVVSGHLHYPSNPMFYSLF